jgi:hypothetical protein
MHPLLISQIAQDEIAERIRSIERERLARQASRSASHRAAPAPGVRARLQRLVSGWLVPRPAWRTTFQGMDATAAEPCPQGDRS